MDKRKFCHIKKFLSSLEGVEIHEAQDSIYYEIGFSNLRRVRIRLSDHSKKSTSETSKFDITITQPINSDKLWVVTTKNNLTYFLFTYTELKDYIKYYILNVKASKFNVIDTIPDPINPTQPRQRNENAMAHIKLGCYLNESFNYYQHLTSSKRLTLRQFIIQSVLPKNILKKYVEELNKSDIDFTIEKSKLIKKLSEIYAKLK